jgi:hypothetical protein
LLEKVVMITLGQALAVSPGISQRPFSTSALRRRFKADRISLRSLITQVASQNSLLFIEVRPISLLNGVSTAKELRDKWPTAQADQSTLEHISSIIRPLGASIVYLSKDSRTVGIKGTNASLLSLPLVPLDAKKDAFKDIANGVIAEGAGAGALVAAGVAEVSVTGAAVSALVAVAVIGAFAAFIGAGIFLGIGIVELIAATQDSAGSNPPASGGSIDSTGNIELLPGITIGRIPDGLGNDVLNGLFGIDSGDVPEPGQLPGAGDLAPGDGPGNGNIPGIGIG